MRLFFDPDLASSYREMASRLHLVAAGDRSLRRLAVTVSDRYATALMSKGDRRTAAWQAFIGALDAYLTLAPQGSDARSTLATIVRENRDLLADPNGLNIREFVDAERGELAAVTAALHAAER